jgi:hypothetical protein
MFRFAMVSCGQSRSSWVTAHLHFAETSHHFGWFTLFPMAQNLKSFNSTYRVLVSTVVVGVHVCFNPSLSLNLASLLGVTISPWIRVMVLVVIATLDLLLGKLGFLPIHLVLEFGERFANLLVCHFDGVLLGRV